MNKETKLFGEVKYGLFTPINPYRPQSVKYNEFVALHLELPIFDSTNIPVKDAENVEAVGPITQLFSPTVGWVNKPSVPVFISWAYEERQIYLLTEAPTENPVSKENLHTDTAPLSDKQWHDNAIQKIAVVQDDIARDRISDKSEVEERAERVCFYSKNRENDIAKRSYNQGASDQEKLMQGEIDRLKRAIEYALSLLTNIHPMHRKEMTATAKAALRKAIN